MKSKIVFLLGLFMSFGAYAGMDILDAQISELTARRDRLKQEIESCQKNTKNYKIAGISTLAATGVGVVGNIALHNKIKEAQQAGTGGGGVGVGNANDPRSESQKASEECQMFCVEFPEEATSMGCEC